MFTLLGAEPVYPAPETQWWDGVQIAFRIGTFEVPWYAICIMLGFIAAIVAACMKMWKRYKIPTEPFYWFILIGVPVSIFGANFGSCVLGEPAGKLWSEFWSSFGSGLAVEWGVLFCFVAGLIYFPLVLKLPRYRVRDEFGPTPEVKRVSVWLYMDAILPCVLIAQFVGRWGNYMNQEVYGAVVTDAGLAKFLHDCLPFMWIVRDQVDPNYYQPLFLWEGIGNLAMFVILYVGCEFIKVRKTGDLSAAYFAWYGLFRLCLEPLRDPTYFSIKSIILSIIFLAVSVGFIIINHLVIAKKRDKKVWHSIIYKPMEKSNKKSFPKQIAKLESQIVELKQDPSKVDLLKEKQDKLATYKEDWNKLQTKYESQSYKDSFVRKPNEMVYFGRW